MQNPYFLVAILACGGVLIPTLIEASKVHPSTLLIMLSAGSIIVGAILSPSINSAYARVLLAIFAAGMFYAVLPKDATLAVAIVVGFTSLTIGFTSLTYNTLVSIPYISKPRVLPMVSILFVLLMTVKGWIVDGEPVFDYERIIGVLAGIVAIFFLGRKIVS